MTLRCPNCKSIQLGKIGSDQYYCWNCFVEFHYSKEQINMYEVSENGSLVSILRNHEMFG
ncbi:MAG: hypothetical protein LBK69_00955 [Syntrophomonadaceae bacterium]|nr:hypothetical protein [Syntrophomonadaceae bacterium]